MAVKKTLQKIEWAIKKQNKNLKRLAKQNVGHHYTQTYSKTQIDMSLLQTTRGKDEPNIIFMQKS